MFLTHEPLANQNSNQSTPTFITHPTPSALALPTTKDGRRAPPPRHVRAVEARLGPHVRGRGRQHLLLAIDQVGGVKRRQLEAMPVGYRVRWASFHAVPAKNAAVVVDVVHLGVPLGAAHPVRLGVLCSLNIDAVRWT